MPSVYTLFSGAPSAKTRYRGKAVADCAGSLIFSNRNRSPCGFSSPASVSHRTWRTKSKRTSFVGAGWPVKLEYVSPSAFFEDCACARERKEKTAQRKSAAERRLRIMHIVSAIHIANATKP